MLRSLFSGISGMNTHLTMLDVVGNNISNVNTIGYKSSRVTFRELLTQTVRGATRPISGEFGGTNPAQIGLGSTIQSIDSSFQQGNLQNTGKITDLAIEGDGFFTVADGPNRYYTRAGTFVFDGLGQLVTSGTGYVVQGIMADDQGVLDYGAPLEALAVSADLVTPAQATEELDIAGNLNADSDALGTITRSQRFMAVARPDDLMTGMYDSVGGDLLLREGQTVNMSFDAGGTTHSASLNVTATTTVQDLVDRLNTMSLADASFSLQPDGSIEVQTFGNAVDDLTITADGASGFNSKIGFSKTIPAGSTENSEELRGAARETDLLEDLYDTKGFDMTFIDGSVIQIVGTVGGVVSSGSLTYTAGATTLGQLATLIENTLSISNSNGVSVDSSGRILVEGDEALSNEVSQIDVNIPGSFGTLFTTNMIFSETQAARDPEQWSSTATVYDSLGRDFRVSMNFTKRTGTNLWDWAIETPDDVSLLAGGAGTIGFGPDGRLTSFDFTDGGTQVVMDPGNGADVMQVSLDPGSFGGLDGLLQFDGASTATAKDFDGHGAGSLSAVTINRQGEMVGQFTNGINRVLGQIALAEFNNSSGMQRIGNNLFSTSSNTGPESITYVGQNANGVITPGALEMSNVDLSKEFTEMIVAQRGFQANARVISTGDEMLSELVTLRR